MALKMDIELPNNFGEVSKFSDVYIKVESINCNKSEGVAAVSFAKKSDNFILQTLNYHFPIDVDGSNFITQAYEYLQTLTEFSDAKAC